MHQWYLATHKPGKSNALKAQLFLSNVGVDVFIPQICNLSHRADRPGRFRKTIEPLFPGYLFICFDYEQIQINKVENCPGIGHLVRFGGLLKPLHESILDEIITLTATVCNDGKVRSVGESKKSKIKKVECGRSSIKELRESVRQIASDINGEKRSMLFYSFLDAIKDRS